MPIGTSPSGLGQAAHGMPPNYGQYSDPAVMHDVDPYNTINPDYELGLPPNVDFGMVQKGVDTPMNQFNTPEEQLAVSNAHAQQIAYSQPTPAQVAAALNAMMAAQRGWDMAAPTPTQAPTGYEDAFNAPMGWADAINATLAAMNPAPQEAQVSDAPNAEAPSMGYGYGLNLGNPAANAPDPGSTAAALAEAQGYADSQSSPTGYGYGLSANLGQPDNSTTSDTSATAAPSMGYGYGINANQAPANTSAFGDVSAAPAAAVSTTGNE